ncbi:MAG: GNAT family N-acetyltransferase [Janthinobacterium lividum]
MTAVVRLVPDALQLNVRQAIMGSLRADTRAKHDGDRQILTLALRDDGALIGGLVGQTFMGWLTVDGLWVSVDHRGRGHATRLMAEAEDEARRRGATDSVLDTFSFQAPEFYRKLGYRDFARLDGFPAGHCRHYLTKSL